MKKSKLVFFTCYESEALCIEKLTKADALWYCLGFEVSFTTGRRHIQGIAYAKKRQSWKDLYPWHIEVPRDIIKSIDYCMHINKFVHKIEYKKSIEVGQRPTNL